jgi:hypothetical protein
MTRKHIFFQNDVFGAESRSGGSKPRALGARAYKKVKAARRAGWALVERVPKTAPKAAVFCHLFTGTLIQAVDCFVLFAT